MDARWVSPTLKQRGAKHSQQVHVEKRNQQFSHQKRDLEMQHLISTVT